MLLPALGKAKAKAHEITCVSQVKQLTLAVNMYAQDWNNILPARYYRPPSNAWSQGWWRNDCATYIPDRNIFICPATTQEYRSTSSYTTYGYNQDYLNWQLSASVQSPSDTVAICDVKRTNNSGGGTHYDGNVLRPSRWGTNPTAHGNEQDPWPFAGDTNYWGRPRAHHLGKCVVGWLDGHATSEHTNRFFYQQNPTDLHFDRN